jgi:hypothetical protein
MIKITGEYFHRFCSVDFCLLGGVAPGLEQFGYAFCAGFLCCGLNLAGGSLEGFSKGVSL